MSSDLDRAKALANKITTKAEAALAGLDREMEIMKWAPEFRKIMWETVAQVATAYAQQIETEREQP